VSLNGTVIHLHTVADAFDGIIFGIDHRSVITGPGLIPNHSTLIPWASIKG
jgi:hypothetical protein